MYQKFLPGSFKKTAEGQMMASITFPVVADVGQGFDESFIKRILIGKLQNELNQGTLEMGRKWRICSSLMTQKLCPDCRHNAHDTKDEESIELLEEKLMFRVF